MTQLSPAETVWDAYERELRYISIYQRHDAALAAAIRALVDQVIPPEERPHSKHGLLCFGRWEQRMTTRNEILAIADELESETE